MAFALSEIGFERGAMQLVLSECIPQWENRNQLGSTKRRVLLLALLTEAETETLKTLLGENPRADTVGLTGESIVCEWTTTPDGSGPVTVKVDPTTSDTLTCAFREGWKVTPITGPYPDNAPTGIRWYKAKIPVAVLS